MIILVSQKLLEFLNKAIARELQVSIQYMWQHVQVTGTEGAIVEDIFRKTAIAEMKHAERLAEQLDYLNGVPTTNPDPIFVGGSLIEMLKQDQQDEEASYRDSIRRQFKRQQKKAITPQDDCLRQFWLKKKTTSTLSANSLSA